MKRYYQCPRCLRYLPALPNSTEVDGHGTIVAHACKGNLPLWPSVVSVASRVDAIGYQPWDTSAA